MKPQLRHLVRGIYDIQKLRIQTGNRLASHYTAKLQAADEGDLLQQLKQEHKRLTDQFVTKRDLQRYFRHSSGGIISDFAEFIMVNTYVDLLNSEMNQIKVLQELLKEYPVWTNFLKDIKGVGPLMAGVLLSEIDITKATYPSSLWKYAGLDVVILPDGRSVGRSRRRECLVDKGNGVKGLSYNPFLKTKLMGVLAPSFLRAKSQYADIYYGYKHRLENHPNHRDKSKMHRHTMACRYMIKMFLRDLYVAWRTLEGLPVSEDYASAKLNMKHGQKSSDNLIEPASTMTG